MRNGFNPLYFQHLNRPAATRPAIAMISVPKTHTCKTKPESGRIYTLHPPRHPTRRSRCVFKNKTPANNQNVPNKLEAV